jgi:hypothetical protein
MLVNYVPVLLLDLVERGVLAKDQGGGRSTSYSLAAADAPSKLNR